MCFYVFVCVCCIVLAVVHTSNCLPIFYNTVTAVEGNGLNSYNESESLLKYELMDGTLQTVTFIDLFQFSFSV